MCGGGGMKVTGVGYSGKQGRESNVTYVISWVHTQGRYVYAVRHCRGREGVATRYYR